MEIAMLDSPIVTGSDEGLYVCLPITTARAKALCSGERRGFVVSYLGGKADATAFGAAIGRDVAARDERFMQQPGDIAVCLKLNERLPEGAVIDLPAMQAIGYEFFALVRMDQGGAFTALQAEEKANGPLAAAHYEAIREVADEAATFLRTANNQLQYAIAT